MMAALITGLRVKRKPLARSRAAAQVMRSSPPRCTWPTRPIWWTSWAPAATARHLQHLHLRDVRGRRGGAQDQQARRRSVSSKSGSADVLDLGMSINLQPGSADRPLHSPTVGVGFMFAPSHRLP